MIEPSPSMQYLRISKYELVTIHANLSLDVTIEEHGLVYYVLNVKLKFFPKIVSKSRMLFFVLF